MPKTWTRMLTLSLVAAFVGAPSSMPSASPHLLDAVWSAAPAIVPLGQLEEGANSFTERQARNRLSGLRLNSVRNMRKDERGFWRGLAWHAGQEIEIAMDFHGRIAAGPELAALDHAALRTER